MDSRKELPYLDRCFFIIKPVSITTIQYTVQIYLVARRSVLLRKYKTSFRLIYLKYLLYKLFTPINIA